MRLNRGAVRRALLIIGGGVALHLIAMVGLLWSMGEVMTQFDGGTPASSLVNLVELLIQIVWFPTLKMTWAPEGIWGHAVLLLNTTAWAALGYWAVQVLKRRTNRATGLLS